MVTIGNEYKFLRFIISIDYCWTLFLSELHTISKYLQYRCGSQILTNI